ncbi:HD domain-containing protein [Clostridium butyricum]|uniref:HD domain-containing protein n=1 Tax=Clostridium butyricum TaxID=1492 RepID=UPI002AB27B10|nr:HD domain-containing protein [Clostridium butyricum]
MVYSDDKEELNKILLNINGNEILSFRDKILKLVPELIVCNDCEHEHTAHKYNVYLHILHVVAGVDNDLTLKLAALFHDIGKPYVKKIVNNKIPYWEHEKVSCIISNLVLNRLGYDENIINDVCTLINIHDKKVQPKINDIKLVIDKIGQINFERLLKLQISDISAHADWYAEIILPKLYQLKEMYINNKF